MKFRDVILILSILGCAQNPASKIAPEKKQEIREKLNSGNSEQILEALTYLESPEINLAVDYPEVIIDLDVTRMERNPEVRKRSITLIQKLEK